MSEKCTVGISMYNNMIEELKEHEEHDLANEIEDTKKYTSHTGRYVDVPENLFSEYERFKEKNDSN